jgi:2-oxoglutarate ferredoxin oxidoreductase subunit alpha
MQENIGYAALAEIPCVIVDVQRAGPSTGLPTSPSQGDYMQARWGTHGDHPVIVISPSSVQEAYIETIRSFNLSERLRVPVILLMDEIIGHLYEGIELPDADEVEILDRLTKDDPRQAELPYDIVPGELAPRMTPFGQGVFYNITGLIHDDRGFPTSSPEIADRQCRRIMKKIDLNSGQIGRYEELYMEDAGVCVVSFGGAARSAQAAVEAARRDGYRVGFFRPVTVWPFPEEAFYEICGRVSDVIVAELNYGQMKLEAERIAAGRCRVRHIGKVDGTILGPEEIYKEIQEAAG